MLRRDCGGFSLVVPPGWHDTTAEVGQSAPFTLTKSDGVGAVQFTVALYQRGPFPNPSPDDLLEMLLEFARARGVGQEADVQLNSTPSRFAAASFCLEPD